MGTDKRIRLRKKKQGLLALAAFTVALLITACAGEREVYGGVRDTGKEVYDRWYNSLTPEGKEEEDRKQAGYREKKEEMQNIFDRVSTIVADPVHSSSNTTSKINLKQDNIDKVYEFLGDSTELTRLCLEDSSTGETAKGSSVYIDDTGIISRFLYISTYEPDNISGEGYVYELGYGLYLGNPGWKESSLGEIRFIDGLISADTGESEFKDKTENAGVEFITSRLDEDTIQFSNIFFDTNGDRVFVKFIFKEFDGTSKLIGVKYRVYRGSHK